MWYSQEGTRSGLQRIFLEVFSGSAHLANSFRALGWTVETVDILSGQDILDESFFTGLLDRTSCKRFGYIHGGTPCTTFSTAKRPAARSSEHPRGLPDANTRLRAQVKEGNEFVRRTLRIFRAACGSLPALEAWETVCEHPAEWLNL